MQSTTNLLSTNSAKTGETLNISAYKFVRLDNLPVLRSHLKSLAKQYNLKGTVLLASEGINLFVAGSSESVYRFLHDLQLDVSFSNLPIKESWSENQPFSRMLVKVKKEIIAFGIDSVNPADKPSRKINAVQLKQWLDEGRQVTLLDTRNRYEVELGTFDGAIDLGIDNFRQFPEQVLKLSEELRDKPMVMFCTGGIRCEKAGPYLEQSGFRNVYQLDGGILRYFEECGDAHYQGDCFVFDDRVAVQSDLEPSGAVLCYRCQHVLTTDDIATSTYQIGQSCPHCFRSDVELKRRSLASRQSILDRLAANPPGCTPYINVRPIHIPRRLHGQSLIECLLDLFPQLTESYWQAEHALSLLRLPIFKPLTRSYTPAAIELEGEVVSLGRIMREGERVNHYEVNCVEPTVAAQVAILDEDDCLIVVDKGAGLPTHSSGRYHRNTLENFLQHAYDHEKVRLVHRLDANTSGVMVLARRYWAAKELQKQFADAVVEKEYVARVVGDPNADQFECHAPISRHCNSGGVRTIDSLDGLKASTYFKVHKRLSDGTVLLRVRPSTGRTNQIRCHLWHLGLPIVGDPAYLTNGQQGENRTKSPNELRMFLHASQLTIAHPKTGVRQIWRSEPINFETTLESGV